MSNVICGSRKYPYLLPWKNTGNFKGDRGQVIGILRGVAMVGRGGGGSKAKTLGRGFDINFSATTKCHFQSILAD